MKDQKIIQKLQWILKSIYNLTTFIGTWIYWFKDRPWHFCCVPCGDVVGHIYAFQLNWDAISSCVGRLVDVKFCLSVLSSTWLWKLWPGIEPNVNWASRYQLRKVWFTYLQNHCELFKHCTGNLLWDDFQTLTLTKSGSV